jgi:hypothetical protein
MPDIESNTLFSDYQEEVMSLQLYPYNQSLKVEICKIFCCSIAIITSIIFIVIAASKYCIYNCPN